MTFQEKVDSLSKDEQGQLKGGFVAIELDPLTLNDIKNKNTKECENDNCSDNIKNKGASCHNTDCMCACSSVNPNPPSNFPCTGIGHL